MCAICLGNTPCRRIGKLVRLADDKVLEGEARVQRGRDGPTTLCLFLFAAHDRLAPAARCDVRRPTEGRDLSRRSTRGRLRQGRRSRTRWWLDDHFEGLNADVLLAPKHP